MKHLKLFLILSTFAFISCNTDEYPDDIYCAEVEYYNPETGTQSTYQLNIEIEERYLLKIFWPNGGWLDDDHFKDVYIDDSGYAKFTSDKGYEYTINITGPECINTDADEMEEDIKNDVIPSEEPLD